MAQSTSPTISVVLSDPFLILGEMEKPFVWAIGVDAYTVLQTEAGIDIVTESGTQIGVDGDINDQNGVEQ